MNAKHVILRLLGFRKPLSKTKLGKVMRVLNRALGVLAFYYLALILYPQVLFGYSSHHSGITLYAQEPIPDEEASRVAQAARTKLMSSQLLEKGDHFRVFLCNSKAVFWLLSPLARFSFANNSPLTENTIVAKADVSTNTARTHHTTNTRLLSDLIVHECSHVLIKRRIGFFTPYMKPRWIQEGYCEYLAGSSTVGDEEGDAWIREGWKGESVPLDYHLWRRMVEYLITQEKRDIQQLIRTPPEYTDVLAKTRNWITNRKALPKSSR